MTTPALLHCPFCRRDDRLLVWHDPRTDLHPWFRVECDNCGAKGPGSDRGDHIEQWNARNDILDWLQRHHTLHRAVEIWYVVDGYEVRITHDDAVIAGPWSGATLREAILQAMANWNEGSGR